MKHKRTTELRYPGLWRGCVGAWAPCLGPTGLTLRDWSGFRRHGALTGMTTPNAWVIENRHSLQFGNLSSEYVPVSSLGISTSRGALTCWVKKRDAFVANTDYMIYAKRTSLTDRLVLEFETYSPGGVGTSPQLTFAFGDGGVAGNFVFGPITSVGVWYFVAVIWETGSPVKMFINGTQYVSGSNYAAQSETAEEIIGNLTSTTSLSFGGQIDDIRRYTRPLLANEIALLGSRRGIAYELAPRRRSSSGIAFNRRRRLLVGAGS